MLVPIMAVLIAVVATSTEPVSAVRGPCPAGSHVTHWVDVNLDSVMQFAEVTCVADTPVTVATTTPVTSEFDWEVYLAQNCSAPGDGEPAWLFQVGADPTKRIGIIIAQCPDEVMLDMILNPDADVTSTPQQLEILLDLLTTKAQSATTTEPPTTSTSTTIAATTTQPPTTAPTAANRNSSSASLAAAIAFFAVVAAAITWRLLHRPRPTTKKAPAARG